MSEEEGGFTLPEAKTRASYKSRDVLYVGSDFGEGSLTDSGYPRVIKEWTRGTKIEDAPVVFEGEKEDVSVSMYVNDQRLRGGPIYEIQSRSMTFYTTKKWVRRVQYEHLLAEGDSERGDVGAAEDFVELDVQEESFDLPAIRLGTCTRWEGLHLRFGTGYQCRSFPHQWQSGFGVQCLVRTDGTNGNRGIFLHKKLCHSLHHGQCQVQA